MVTINVRHLDDDVVQRLRRRAADNNRTLESEVRAILERASKDDMEMRRGSFVEASDRLREITKGTYQTPSEFLIREDREQRSRESA